MLAALAEVAQRTVLLSVHQPSSQVFALLDHLTLLADGRALYRGAAADVSAFLARASVLLARLQDIKVVELLATVLEEMVQGEMMQVKAMPEELLEFDHYLSKTYRKTAALMVRRRHAAATRS